MHGRRRGLIDWPAGRAGGCPSIEQQPAGGHGKTGEACTAAYVCAPDSFEFYRMPAGAACVRFAAHWARANLHARAKRQRTQALCGALLFLYIICPYVSVRGCDSLTTRSRERRKRVRWSRNWFREIAEVLDGGSGKGKRGRRRCCLPRHLIGRLPCPSVVVCLRPKQA